MNVHTYESSGPCRYTTYCILKLNILPCLDSTEIWHSFILSKFNSIEQDLRATTECHDCVQSGAVL